MGVIFPETAIERLLEPGVADIGSLFDFIVVRVWRKFVALAGAIKSSRPIQLRPPETFTFKSSFFPFFLPLPLVAPLC